MTTRYVGIGGDDASDGLSWANRKLTLNGAEDTPVEAGDTVYVGAGTYREKLTSDVDGSVGNIITYIGDYDGSNTDGVGGVVRITGSDNELTATRDSCIDVLDKDYRTFQNFKFDLSTAELVSIVTGNNVIIDKCYFSETEDEGIKISAGATSITIKNSYFNTGFGGYDNVGMRFEHTTGISDCACVVENCLFVTGFIGVDNKIYGGVLIKNSTFMGMQYAARVTTALPAGQVMTVNNSIITGMHVAGFRATVAGELVEDYNTFYNNLADRNTVNVGANSLTYPPLFDSRWFFEAAAKNQKLVTPFDLSSLSQLINVAGTSPSTSDMRGASAIGAQREWGVLEHNPNLSTGGGVSRGRTI